MIRTRTADRPLEGRAPRLLDVVLGSRWNGAPAVTVLVIPANSVGASARFTFESADEAEALAHALLTAADHLREAATS